MRWRNWYHGGSQTVSLKVRKTKELVVDFRGRQEIYSPLIIGGTPVNRVSSFKYLNVHITEDLTWTHHIHARDVQQRSSTRLWQRWSIMKTMIVGEKILIGHSSTLGGTLGSDYFTCKRSKYRREKREAWLWSHIVMSGLATYLIHLINDVLGY